MCSNGSYGDLQKDDNYDGSSCPKKQKKDRVRRRGPGVAELEKIRLQQENKSTLHTLFVPPPPPETSLYTTTHPVFRPPPTTATEKLPSPGFPFIPPAPVFQRKQHSSSSSSLHHHHSMNLSNPSPKQGEFYQFIELPSNQRSYVENEEKSSSKRPWHFHTDTKKASDYVPISKESKQNRSLDMRLISPVQDSGSTICRPIAIASTTTTFTRNYPMFIPLSLQFEQQQKEKNEFDEKMKLRSKKPFCSFIPSNDQSTGDREQRACELYESASDHGIDLNLKL